MRLGLALTATLFALGALTCTSPAQADDKTRCISASEQGQQLRDDGKYSQARDAFTTCSRDACPAIVRRDCTRWLAELEELWPTVVFGAKDEAGRDLSAVQVTMDGQPVADSIDGKPVFADPGAHVFRFTAQGYASVEQDVVLRASEKGRAIEVQFGAGGGGPAPPRTPAKLRSGPLRVESADAPAGAWVLAGAALVAFGTEAYFGVSGLSDRSALLAQPCSKTATCNGASVQAIRTKFAVADVALGVGVVSAVVATYLFLSQDPLPRKVEGAHLDVAPVPGGGAGAVLQGCF